MAEQIKMPHGRKVGLDPSDIVLDGDAAPPPQKGQNPSLIFGPCLLWPNGWMDQDAPWNADGVRIGATWRIRLNHPCALVMSNEQLFV